MRSIKPRLLVKAVHVLLVTLAWGIATRAAGPQLDKDFKADELVTSVAVTLHVDPKGEDLQEPVALDLGLGFPLLLAPV